jgi:L-Ala-D/L-Glu epimerase
MIERIAVCPARLPMDRPFVHAEKRRTRTASVLVNLVALGAEGWGECAPRSYVTGESMASVADALGRVTPQLLDELIDPGHFGDSIRTLARLDLAGILGGAAAAAGLETALFDLICRVHGRDGYDALRCVPEFSARPVPVSLVVDLARDPDRLVADLTPEVMLAIRHVKIKSGADIDECVRRVGLVRGRFGADLQISVDVNGGWQGVDAVAAASRLRDLDVAWLEEPVGARDWVTMRDIRLIAGIPVMLDESCTGRADLAAAVQHGAVDYVNARVSKSGGVFPTLKLIAAARAAGVGVQLGVHVGEIGPLWAVGRLLSCSVHPLVAVEAGRHEEWFGTPLTEPAFAVDRETYLAEPLGGPGTGVIPSAFLRAALPLQDQTPTTTECAGERV